MYYLTMSYPNHHEVIFESDDFSAVKSEYEFACADTDYNRANNVEYYEVWSDDGSILTCEF